EKIEEYLTPKYMDMKITYFKEEKPLGTLFSMRNLLEHRRDEDIMLRNGDTVTDMNFKAMLKFAKNSSYGAVLFAVKMRSPYGILEIFGDTVTRFKEKPLIDAYINAGIYIFKKETLDFFFESYPEKSLKLQSFQSLLPRGR
ncbi:nucleotidyl transferase, partial [mine drainage metagenome]